MRHYSKLDLGQGIRLFINSTDGNGDRIGVVAAAQVEMALHQILTIKIAIFKVAA